MIQTDAGNVLWDCISLIDEATVERVGALGGISAIAISHPHFYGSCVAWAEAFDARIVLPAADRQWLQCPSPLVEHVEDADHVLVPGVRLVRVGGHFHGSSVLLWEAGAAGRGALFTGDSVGVMADPRWVSFMYSYPNEIPLSVAEVREIEERLAPLAFDRIYGGWPGDIVDGDAADVVRRSAQRYVGMLEGTWPRR